MHTGRRRREPRGRAFGRDVRRVCRRSIAFGLGRKEDIVFAVLFHQLAMVADLNYLSILQHYDLAGGGGAGKAVRNKDGRLDRKSVV